MFIKNCVPTVRDLASATSACFRLSYKCVFSPVLQVCVFACITSVCFRLYYKCMYSTSFAALILPTLSMLDSNLTFSRLVVHRAMTATSFAILG